MNTLRLTSVFPSKASAVLLVFCIVVFYFSVDWCVAPRPVLGVVYWYDRDSTFMIASELERIKANGFQIISVGFIWNPNSNDAGRVATNYMYDQADKLGLEVYLRELWSSEGELEQYLHVYGDKISYLQVINEADMQLLKKWDVPDELIAKAQKNAEIAKRINPNIKTVASFATPLLPTMVHSIASFADIIAIDVYEDLQLDTFPLQMQSLMTAAGKHTLWIGEFGKSSLDDKTQANFIIKGLDLFKKNGVETVIIWGWNVAESGLVIRGRQAETDIANWAIK